MMLNDGKASQGVIWLVIKWTSEWSAEWLWMSTVTTAAGEFASCGLTAFVS